MPCGRISTASRLPQSRRLRRARRGLKQNHVFRLKIAAVAATAANVEIPALADAQIRLKIAAVAATAA